MCLAQKNVNITCIYCTTYKHAFHLLHGIQTRVSYIARHTNTRFIYCTAYKHAFHLLHNVISTCIKSDTGFEICLWICEFLRIDDTISKNWKFVSSSLHINEESNTFESFVDLIKGVQGLFYLKFQCNTWKKNKSEMFLGSN